MARLIVLTHADVVVNPKIPVPDWDLSDRGRARHHSFNDTLQSFNIKSIFCSTEVKAQSAAALYGLALNLTPQSRSDLGKNDRTATGYLPKAEFEDTADQFFASPENSVRGWERAVDAQSRFVGAARDVAAKAPPGDVLVVTRRGGGPNAV